MFSTDSTRLTHEPVRELVYTGINGSTFSPIGDRLTYPARQIMYQNDTDDDIWFSFNGIDKGFFLRPGQDFIQDITVNQVGERGVFLPAGDYVYAMLKGTPTTGYVYVTVFYGQD